MEKHSRTPWRVEHRTLIVSAEGRDIADLDIQHKLTREKQDQNAANAELIVRAVNAHEELLDALKFIAEGAGTFSMNALEHASNTIREMKEVAKQAIAKAEGSL